MHLIQFSRKEFGQDIRVQSLFAKCATGALLTATPVQGLWVTTKERRDLTVPWQPTGGRPVQMYKVKNYSPVAKSSTSTWLSLPWLLTSVACASWEQLMNSMKEICQPMALEWQEWEARTGLPQQGFVSFPLLSSFSVTLLCFILHPIPASWKVLILTIPHPHKCRCTIHTGTKSMYIFSCRGNMVFMLYKMNKEKRKPRILGYCPNHTALKSAVHWKKTPHNKKIPYSSFQEKCLGFPICLRLMSTHKRLNSRLEETGLAYNTKNLSFLNWGTIS